LNHIPAVAITPTLRCTCKCSEFASATRKSPKSGHRRFLIATELMSRMHK
jgi:hypothetical protein